MLHTSNRTVPLVDLAAQYAEIGTELEAAIREVISTQQYIHGPFARAFEQAFAQYCGVKHAIGVGNGTDALILALRALGIGPGDEVVTTPFTFTATAEAIFHCGATIRFVDVDPQTRNLDPRLLPEVLTEHTRAVLPVHLYGLTADVPAIAALVAGRQVAIVEDAAQAVGARLGQQRAGSLGDVACFSFYPSKNLGAHGDAGAIVTQSDDVAARIRCLSDHGRISKYEHGQIGVNSRLDGLQAAILSVKLRHLDAWNERRNHLAAQYSAALSDVPGIRTPATPAGMYAVYHLYVIEAPQRDALCAYLQRHGVAAAVHYPLPLHLQPAYAWMELPPGSFPVSERLAQSVLSLPIYPELRDEDVAWIAGLIASFYREQPAE